MLFDLDGWQEIWSTIRRNRLRTFLTALGVFWGIFMLIVMVGAGNGLENGVHNSMRGYATNSVFMWGERTSIPFRGLRPGRSIEFDNADIDAIRAVPGVEHMAPRNRLGGWRGGNNVTRGSKAGAFQVSGDLPEIQHIQPVTLPAGRHLNQLDVAGARKVAVIGTRVQELLFGADESPIGQAILIRGVYFQVVGIHKSISSGENGERLATTIHIPFSTFQQVFNARNQVGWFSFTVKPGHRAAGVEAAVKRVLQKRHNVAPDDAEAIDGFNAEEEFRKLTNLFFGIRILIWFVGVATLLAGVVGVSNIMMISVKERTREIGVRKALGATPRRIVGQILQESVILTALAGYLGIVCGVALLEAVGSSLGSGDNTMFARPQIGMTVALVATGVLILSGALAGVLPARNAARVNPVIALRSE